MNPAVGTPVHMALLIANAAHDGQHRIDGKPYITHPINVARMFPKEDPRRIIALLHDAIEDTIDLNGRIDKFLVLKILDSFGPRILSSVLLLTRPVGQSYAGFIEAIATSGDTWAIQVKLSDLIDNLSDMPASKESLRKRYMAALARLWAALDTSVNV